MFLSHIVCKESQQSPSPGEGLRSLRTTTLFRAVNFELYAKPNNVIMAIGVACLGISVGYIYYMRQKYEKLGYYAAVGAEDKDVFLKRDSKWDN
ncbi:hypothetical protein R5R35_011146 [Gryllus longicercus]|uniref:Small integral membrane protein 8 n=1 Tax=Gryllus longicercus TaxID=2509291 RepID=A0AAN9Z0U1_9ORTH